MTIIHSRVAIEAPESSTTISSITTLRTTIRAEVLSCRTYTELREYLRGQCLANPCLEIIEAQPEEDILAGSDIDDEPEGAITDEISFSEEEHWDFEDDLRREDKCRYDEMPEDFLLPGCEIRAGRDLAGGRAWLAMQRSGGVEIMADVSRFHGTDQEVELMRRNPEEMIEIDNFPRLNILFHPRKQYADYALKARLLKKEYDCYVPRLRYYLSRLCCMQRTFFQEQEFVRGLQALKTLPRNKFIEALENVERIPEEFKMDSASFSRMIQERFIAVHSGVVLLEIFFPASRGNSLLNESQIRGMLMEYLERDPLLTDVALCEKLAPFKVSRSDIQKKRRELGFLSSRATGKGRQRK